MNTEELLENIKTWVKENFDIDDIFSKGDLIGWANSTGVYSGIRQQLLQDKETLQRKMEAFRKDPWKYCSPTYTSKCFLDPETKDVFFISVEGDKIELIKYGKGVGFALLQISPREAHELLKSG